MKRDPTLKRFSRQLRKAQTPAESRLWHELRNRRFADYKFRRQHPIGPFIADFYCANAGLIIELDGESHLGRDVHDRERQDWLESRGLKVLRFYNNDTPANLDELLECVYRECRERDRMAMPRPLTPGPSPWEGRGEQEADRSVSMLRTRGPLTPGPSPREGRGEQEAGRSVSMLRTRGPLTPGPSPREGRGEQEGAASLSREARRREEEVAASLSREGGRREEEGAASPSREGRARS